MGITDLMNALKNIAVEEGYVHPSYIEQIKALSQFDGLYEIGDYDNKKREKIGLPRIDRKGAVLKSIMERTGILGLAQEGGQE